ncbi:hypothetical protein H2248_000154 [Termitomyces sp. 'cryptogamus']|nr:hypothetical protein H2248_000154 [Termitomyces sp. 'cryptogamus']
MMLGILFRDAVKSGERQDRCLAFTSFRFRRKPLSHPQFDLDLHHTIKAIKPRIQGKSVPRGLRHKAICQGQSDMACYTKALPNKTARDRSNAAIEKKTMVGVNTLLGESKNRNIKNTERCDENNVSPDIKRASRPATLPN